MTRRMKKYKPVCFRGIPLSVASNGDVKIDPLGMVLLKRECVNPGVHTELIRFIRSHAPDISETDMQELERDYPEVVKDAGLYRLHGISGDSPGDPQDDNQRVTG